jgi:uncharacterized membrane protein (UPF0127 family)
VRPLALFLFLALVPACGGEQGARAVIETKGDEVTVHVEVADTQAERARGLMGRRELPDDAGMVFVFPTDSTSAFWMKDTLIPLSIAFYDESGTIVRILDMEPCIQDPCARYDPEASYRGALEVNRGAFEGWGVREGNVLRLER